MKMLTRSVIRALYNQKTKDWQPDGITVEVHTGDLTGTHGASSKFTVLVLNMNGEKTQKTQSKTKRDTKIKANKQTEVT